MIVVSSHFREDVEWLRDIPFPTLLIDKIGAEPHTLNVADVIPNLGCEASVYLHFITVAYDILPERVAFIHGHNNAWHHYHVAPLATLLSYADPSVEFVTLNGFWVEKNNPVKHSRFWHTVEPWIGPPPAEPIFTDAAAQFIVSRKRIHSRPREFYVSLYNFTMSLDAQTAFEFATFLEDIWHIIFGEPAQFTKRDFPVGPGLPPCPLLEQSLLDYHSHM